MNAAQQTAGLRLKGWRLWLPGLAILLLFAAHTVYWRYAVHRLRSGLSSWTEQRRAEGWVVSSGPAVVGGWPWAAAISLPNVSLKGGDPAIPGGLTWSAERALLRVALLRPRQFVLSAEGMEHLGLASGPEIVFAADRLTAELPLLADVPMHAAEILGRNLRIALSPAEGTAGRAADLTQGLTLGLVQAQWEARPAALPGEPALSLHLTSEAISLPPGERWPLGRRISSLSLEGAVQGPVPNMASSLAQRAAAWRDGGGTLAIEHLSLGWGPLGLSARATLALDDQLQPMGTGSARLVGYAETLAALAENGLISAHTATAVRALLALIAKVPEEGGQAEVEVPLTLQDRTLSIRQIPLERLPAWVWRGS
ncbi:MAG: DUF2125 domain-containing protein [Geminicoccaceae bacterium]